MTEETDDDVFYNRVRTTCNQVCELARNDRDISVKEANEEYERRISGAWTMYMEAYKVMKANQKGQPTADLVAENARLTRELEALYDACAVRGVNFLEGRWFAPIFGFEASPKPFRERAPYYPSREACLEAVRRAVSESMEGKP